MAHEAETKELIEKVGNLFTDRFGGDHRKAFAYYDRDGKGIDTNELSALLADAGIGTWLTRGLWAAGIIKALDVDMDGAVSFAEFEAVLSAATH